MATATSVSSSAPRPTRARDSILRNAGKPVATIPAVPGHPLIGNILKFRSDRLGLQDEAARLGPIARVSIFTVPVYIVTDADLAHQLLVDEADTTTKSAGLQFLKPLLGDGLLTAEGAHHKRHRKLLAPAFAPKRLAAYGQTMVRETAAQVAGWGATARRVDFAHEMMELTLTIAGKTMFGADVRANAAQIAKGLELGMHAMQASLSSPIQLGYDWPLPRHLQMKKAVKLIDEVVFRLIREGRAAGVDRGDVLSMLLLANDEDGGALTDAEVRDEVMTLLLAGHETTANALTWTWYELGRNPEALARLQDEVRAVCGDREITTADLPNMPWNLAVLDEAMRLHPPAYMTGRETQQPITLGGHQLPAKAIVAVNIRGIHRRADYFPAPLAFRPERMLPEAKKARPRSHYLPFGAGPRVCIGSHFALLEAQLMLATLVQRAAIRPLSAHVAAEPLVTLRPRGGLPAEVRSL